MIYSPEEVKTYKGFRYIERHGMRFFILEGVSRADWLKLRGLDGALGGSDVGTILGWNYRQSRVELFYQKIGLHFKSGESHTQYTYWGTENERGIMRTAQFYDFKDPESYLYNAAEGIIMREITELKFSVRNPAVPYINANIDGLIDFDPITCTARRLAESKTISRKSAEMWESIPPYHLGQVLIYLYALEPMLKEKCAEIYYLQDGNNFYGWEIHQNQILIEIIVEECEKFFEKVQLGLDIIRTIKSPKKRAIELHKIEPDPDDTKAYEQFLKEAYKRKRSFQIIKDPSNMLEVARKYNALDAQLKAGEKELQGYKNEIWQVLSHNQANVIELSNGGKISYNKRLYVKSDPSK